MCKCVSMYNYICASTCLDESLQTWWKVDFLPLSKHASALLCKVCITLQSVQVRGAKIPKFGGREHNFVHNRAGVLLPPPRSVIKEFHQGNIFFSEGEKISGKYCPQSPIIGPFANLFSVRAVFAQSTGGREVREEGGEIIRNCKCCGKKKQMRGGRSVEWFVVIQINAESFFSARKKN